MKITYFASTYNMGDIPETDADGYREWALCELSQEFPLAEIEVSDEQRLISFSCSDESHEDEVGEFCSRLWDRCPWGWVDAP